MISHKYKCAFIHIPKCAGTSVDYVLNNNDLFHKWNGNYHEQHETLFQMDIPDNYFKFSIIRHPIDRLVSSYKFLSNECDGGTFTEFITKSGGFSNILDPEKQHDQENRYHHIMTMFDYIGDGSKLDMVIKMEDINKKWKDVCNIIGHNITLPHMNASSVIYNISKDDKHLVRKLYKIDFENFGYE